MRHFTTGLAVAAALGLATLGAAKADDALAANDESPRKDEATTAAEVAPAKDERAAKEQGRKSDGAASRNCLPEEKVSALRPTDSRRISNESRTASSSSTM